MTEVGTLGVCTRSSEFSLTGSQDMKKGEKENKIDAISSWALNAPIHLFIQPTFECSLSATYFIRDAKMKDTVLSVGYHSSLVL